MHSDATHRVHCLGGPFGDYWHEVHEGFAPPDLMKLIEGDSHVTYERQKDGTYLCVEHDLDEEAR